MMSSRMATRFTVDRGGVFTAVQDRGRFGSRRLGVPLSGALDAYAMRVANLLVGNDADAAVLECTLRGPVLSFDADTIISICGGEFNATLDGVRVPCWRPIRVEAHAVLDVGSVEKGLRCCLAIAGGISTPPVLGSRSTYVRASLGGLDGRALQQGDAVPLGRASDLALAMLSHLTTRSARWFVDARDVYDADTGSITLRATVGTHARLLPGYAEALFARTFTVTPASDRMGYRLRSDMPAFPVPAQLISEPVAPGTVQQPPGDEAIVLLADAQTTGGYARVAHVAQVDLPRLAQASPGTHIRFRQITNDEAVRLLRRREYELERLAHTVRLRFT